MKHGIHLWNATTVRRWVAPADFHSGRWTIVMRGAQSQAPGSQPALAELCRLYWSPLWMFTCVRGVLREEVGRNVSDQEEIDEEIHAGCKTVIVS